MQNEDGKHLVDLPPVEMTVVPVTLPADTRALYDEIEELSRQRFVDYIERARHAPTAGNAVVRSLRTVRARARR